MDKINLFVGCVLFMTCFDVLLNLQHKPTDYNYFVETYYIWYENRVNEVINERGITRATLKPYHPKADLIRALHKLYRFRYDTIEIALENFKDYCRNMEIENPLSVESFGLDIAKKYFDEHEIPFMFRGNDNTICFSKAVDFVSWTALSDIFARMYAQMTTHLKSTDGETQIIVSIYDNFLAPELFQAKNWARGEIFKAFTEWCAETFEDVMIEEKKVTFVPQLCNIYSPVR